MSLLWFTTFASVLCSTLLLAILFKKRERRKRDGLAGQLKEFAGKLKVVPLVYNSPVRFEPPSSFENQSWKTTNHIEPTDEVFPSQIKCITFNTWFSSHRQKERTLALLDVLKKQVPHIVCLQEVTKTSLALFQVNSFVREHFFVSDIYGDTFQGYGVVIMVAKTLIRSCSSVRFYSRALPSQFCRKVAFVDLSFITSKGTEILRVGTAHLESSAGAHGTRKAQLEIITSLFKDKETSLLPYSSVIPSKKPSDEVIGLELQYHHHLFMGDFNFDADWMKLRGTPCAEEEVLKKAKMVDVWEELRGNEAGYTIPEVIGSAPRRIDRIMYQSPMLCPLTIEIIGDTEIEGERCVICESKQRVCSISDHFGLLLEIKL